MAIVVDRTGWGLTSMRQVTFIHQWAMAEGELGHRIGIEEFGAVWGQSVRTAYRRLDEFRRLFPEYGPEGKPDALYTWRSPAAAEPEWGLRERSA